MTTLVTEKKNKQKETVPHRKSSLTLLQELSKNRTLFLMLLPGVIVLLINNYLPMFGIIIAFKDINYAKGFFKSRWVGLQNFKYLFSSNQAFIITRNTILYNLVFILVSITIAVLLAIMFNELLNRKTAKVYQSILFLPYFLSWVVVSYLVFACLSSDMGYVNGILAKLGMNPISWYTEEKYWPFIIVLVNTWKWTGYDSVIYLAAIVGFDKSYYEAAAVDGASRFKQITSITLPMLLPVITVLTLLKIGRVFYADFGLFYNVPKNSGVLYNATNVIDTYVFRSFRQTGDIGMASAAGFYQSVVGFILVFVANYIVRKIDSDNALF